MLCHNQVRVTQATTKKEKKKKIKIVHNFAAFKSKNVGIASIAQCSAPRPTLPHPPQHTHIKDPKVTERKLMLWNWRNKIRNYLPSLL